MAGYLYNRPYREGSKSLTDAMGYSAKLSIAGTPEEWVEKIETDVVPRGFNHLIVAIADPYLVKSWSGMSIEGLPDTRAQLRLIEERVIPMLQ